MLGRYEFFYLLTGAMRSGVYPSLSFSRDNNIVLSRGSTMLLGNPKAPASSMMFWAAAPASKYQNGRYCSPAFLVFSQFNTVMMESGAEEMEGSDDAAASSARLSPDLILYRKVTIGSPTKSAE
jgi:hypothetical protein